MTIRIMEEKDLQEVALIEAESFTDAWSQAAFRESLGLPYTVLTAALGEGRIQGYAVAYLSPGEAEIVKVAVGESYRRRGTGRKLVEDLVRRCKGAGAEGLVLEVRSRNQAALRFYESMGFTRVGIRRRFYERPADDAVIMRTGGDIC